MANYAQAMYAKAQEHWVAAQAELQANRFETATALAYYACFELGLAAHLYDGLPPDNGTKYSHGLIWKTADRWMDAIGRRELRGAVQQLYGARTTAQYKEKCHSRGECEVTINKARDVVDTLSPRLKRCLGLV